MKKRIKQHEKFGLQAPPDDEKAYVLGGGNLPAELLVPEADWKASWPEGEIQNKRGIETYDCTGFAILNAIEIFIFRKYGVRVNYSDRWLGIIAKTGEKRGNDPHTVCEAIRKYGLIPEEMLPFSDDLQSYEDYYSFKGANEQACYEAGRKWLTEFDFLHEWVYRPTAPDDEKKNNLKVALKYSPIPISVYAWATDERGVYVGIGAQNHLTLDSSFKQFMGVYDSYEPFEKLVDQVPLYAKRIYVSKKLTVAQKKSIWESLKSFFKAFLSPQDSEETINKLQPILNPVPMQPTVISMQDKLKKLCIDNIGKDLSELAPNELGCADVMSTILQGIYPDFPRLISTIAFNTHLGLDKRFKRTKLIKPWSIIISPTFKKSIGHVGTIGENNVIYSNNSLTGKLDSHWTIDRWVANYRGKGGLSVIIYELV